MSTGFIPFLGIKPALHDPAAHHPTLSLLQLPGFLKVLSTFTLVEMQSLNALLPDTHVAYFLTPFWSLLNVSYPVRTDLPLLKTVPSPHNPHPLSCLSGFSIRI